MTRACAGLTPAQLIQRIRGDAEKDDVTKGKDYGFLGVPLLPVSGRYYGYLVPAALY